MLTLTSSVLTFDRTESFWMPTDSTISGSFNPLTEKEAPAPVWPLLLLLIDIFSGMSRGVGWGGGWGAFSVCQHKGARSANDCVSACVYACVYTCV